MPCHGCRRLSLPQDGDLKAIDFDSACRVSGGSAAADDADVAERVGGRFAAADHVLTPRYEVLMEGCKMLCFSAGAAAVGLFGACGCKAGHGFLAAQGTNNCGKTS